MKRKSTINIFSSIKCCVLVCLILRIRIHITFHQLILDTLEKKSSINHVVAKYHAFVYSVLPHTSIHTCTRTNLHRILMEGNFCCLPYQMSIEWWIDEDDGAHEARTAKKIAATLYVPKMDIFLFPNNIIQQQQRKFST